MNTSSIKTKSIAMCGTATQNIKIIINDKPIKQVSEFKYTEYLIWDYKSKKTKKDKLQTYNKWYSTDTFWNTRN